MTDTEDFLRAWRKKKMTAATNLANLPRSYEKKKNVSEKTNLRCELKLINVSYAQCLMGKSRVLKKLIFFLTFVIDGNYHLGQDKNSEFVLEFQV